jgi:hypothetical protein
MLFLTLLVAILLLVAKSRASTTTKTTALATTITVSPVPAASACLSDHDAHLASSNHYQPLCDVEFPHQDILPYLWVGDFEQCLHQCDKFNMNETYDHGPNGLICKAALFAPGRFAGSDDCYLKFGLEDPRPANLALVGGIKLPVNQASRTSTRTWGRHSTARTTTVTHSTSTHPATVHTSMSPNSTFSLPPTSVRPSSSRLTLDSSTPVNSVSSTSAASSAFTPPSTPESPAGSNTTLPSILTVAPTHHTHARAL